MQASMAFLLERYSDDIDGVASLRIPLMVHAIPHYGQGPRQSSCCFGSAQLLHEIALAPGQDLKRIFTFTTSWSLLVQGIHYQYCMAFLRCPSKEVTDRENCINSKICKQDRCESGEAHGERRPVVKVGQKCRTAQSCWASKDFGACPSKSKTYCRAWHIGFQWQGLAKSGRNISSPVSSFGACLCIATTTIAKPL